MPSNYMTLSRQALYDLAWSTPMSTLAKDFGISDVALAKRCRAVDVPVPPRGYWARKAAGQPPLARLCLSTEVATRLTLCNPPPSKRRRPRPTMLSERGASQP